MRVPTTVMILAAAAIAACQPARDDAEDVSRFTSADSAAIMALNDSAMKYIIRGDWTSWANNLTEDAIFQPANGRTIVGRQNIEAWARAMPKMDTIHTYNNQVVGSGDLAYMTSGFIARLGGQMGDSSKQLVVFRRVNGEWKVPAISISADTLRMPIAARGTPR